MRFLSRAAAMTSCVFGILSAACAQQDNGPVPIPTKVVGNQWIIKATVGGNEGWYLLSTSTKTSILLPRKGQSGPDGRRQKAGVSIGPVNGDDVNFRIVTSPDLKSLGVDGVLGADALSSFNLAIDVDEAQVSTWVEQPSLYSERGWILLLPLIGSSTQHATTLSIDDVDKAPYGIPCSVGLAHGLTIAQTSEQVAKVGTQALASTDVLSIVEGSAGSSAVDNLSLGDIGPFWLIASNATAPLPYAAGRQIASIPITSLPVRRLVLDGHTGTIVTEQLGSTGVDSVLLSRLLGIPVEVQDGTLYLRKEGALYGSDLKDYDRSLVIDIAGIQALDIVAAIEGTPAQRLAMLKQLASARMAGYKLDLKKGDKDYATTVKKPSS